MILSKSNKLKILILSSSHPFKAAGIGSYHIYKGLKSLNHNVRLLVKEFDKYINEEIRSYYRNRIIYKFINTISKVNKRLNFLKTDREYSVQTRNQRKNKINANILLKRSGFIPDVIIVFFTQGFINFKDLYNIQKKTKATIFFILPDMSVFTGLCHYSWDCNNYKNSCGKCPAIYSNNEKDLSYKNLKKKLYYASKMNIVVLSWSNWLKVKVKESSLFKNKLYIDIPVLGEKEEFVPVNEEKKKELKKKLKIDKNKIVISFSSIYLNLKRKGITDIISAINKISNSIKKDIIVVYSGQGPLPKKLLNVKSVNLGLLNWKELVEFYQISDIFISASIQDVGPASIIEAMLCGVPIVSYNTGIASSWIIEDYNGYLTKDNNPNELFKGIMTFLNKEKYDFREIRENCIKKATEFNDINKYKNIEKILLEYNIAKNLRMQEQ